MFKLNDVVKIKSNGIVGTIVDISDVKGRRIFVVESNTPGKISGAYGGDWALFDCTENELVTVD